MYQNFTSKKMPTMNFMWLIQNIILKPFLLSLCYTWIFPRQFIKRLTTVLYWKSASFGDLKISLTNLSKISSLQRWRHKDINQNKAKIYCRSPRRLKPKQFVMLFMSSSLARNYVKVAYTSIMHMSKENP